MNTLPVVEQNISEQLALELEAFWDRHIAAEEKMNGYCKDAIRLGLGSKHTAAGKCTYSDIFTIVREKQYLVDVPGLSDDLIAAFDRTRGTYDSYGYNSIYVYRGSWSLLVVFKENVGIVGALGYSEQKNEDDTYSYLVHAAGDGDFCKHILNFKQKTTTLPRYNRFKMVYASFGNHIGISSVIPAIPKKILGLSGFYPYFEQSPEETWDDFKDSQEKVMVLMGQPGTGKTTFIASMMSHRGWDNPPYMVDDPVVLTAPGFTDKIRDLPKGSVIILEEADNYIGPRGTGNGNNALMGNLLNLFSGLASIDVRLIVSTNLQDSEQIDQALLRPGRCFGLYKFKPLVGEEINAARKALDLPPVTVDGSSLTLAHALSKERHKTRTKPKVVGFV